MEARSAALRQVSFRAIGWLAVVAMLAVAVLGPSAPRALGATVTPILIEGADNKTCAELAVLHGGGQTWLEAKKDPNGDGVINVEGFGTITISNSQNDKTFDWTSTFGIDAVFVKAGTEGSNLYVYAPTSESTESTGDTGLTSPGAAGNGISHIAFCYDAANPTPSEPPSAPPSEEPSAPPSEEPEPNEALVWVVKVLDLDGDLDTEDDQSLAEGWEFAYDSDGGTIVDSETTTDADGTAWLLVEFDGDSTDVSITETLQTDFEFIDAYCIDLGDIDSEPGDEDFPLADFTIEDLTVSLDVAAQTQYECVFFNTSGEVEEATGTPVITAGPTLPPTDLEGSAAPLSDTWRMALIALAGILASVLVMTPARSTRRR